MKGILAGVSYDTKTVKFKDEQKETTIPMMMTAFDGQDNDTLCDSGFGGRAILFTMMDGGVDESFTDPHAVDHWALGPHITEFMLELRRGWKTFGNYGIDWTEVEDDSTVVLGDFDIKD